MRIERVRQIDSSEPDESGRYEYYYEYDIYRFDDGTICFVARSYIDEPDEAHFLRSEIGGESRPLDEADLTHPLFVLAQAHLRGEGKANLRWLNVEVGYEPLFAAHR
jgi:hypothetical protein